MDWKKIRPLRGWCLIKLKEIGLHQEKTKEGIEYVCFKRFSEYAEVLAVGNDVKELKPGDVVFIANPAKCEFIPGSRDLEKRTILAFCPEELIDGVVCE